MIVGKLVLVDPEPPYLSRVLNTSERMVTFLLLKVVGKRSVGIETTILVARGRSMARWLWLECMPFMVEAENFDQKARWKTIL